MVINIPQTYNFLVRHGGIFVMFLLKTHKVALSRTKLLYSEEKEKNWQVFLSLFSEHQTKGHLESQKLP